MPPLSCGAIVHRASALCVPVLFIDTCSLLDIVRAPVREQVGAHDIAAVHTLLDRVEAQPSRLTIVLNEQVQREFNEHIDEVEGETERELTKSAGRINGILKRMTAFPAASGIPAAIDLSVQGFPNQGRLVAERIIRASLIVADDDQQKTKAFDRVNRAAPPAARGKDSMKDCVITETFLRIAGELKAAGFAQKIVFTTSNKNDYEQSHSGLHPALRLEFSAVAMEYSPTWSAVRYELDRC